MRHQARVVNIPVAVVAKTTTTGKLTRVGAEVRAPCGHHPHLRGHGYESADSSGTRPEARKDSRISALRAS